MKSFRIVCYSIYVNISRYENAYTCQPVCGPARSAIFTGTFPHSNGMVTNGVPLGANVKTIGQRLTDNGIKCGYIGKWHLDGGDYFGLGCCPEGAACISGSRVSPSGAASSWICCRNSQVSGSFRKFFFPGALGA